MNVILPGFENYGTFLRSMSLFSDYYFLVEGDSF